MTDEGCMNDKYILDDKGDPIPCEDLMMWATWFEENRNQRIVKQDVIRKSKVSTVFLGLDHGWPLRPFGHKPILWETIVFGGPLDQEQDRCSGNREQAEAMHARMVENVKSTL